MAEGGTGIQRVKEGVLSQSFRVQSGGEGVREGGAGEGRTTGGLGHELFVRAKNRVGPTEGFVKSRTGGDGRTVDICVEGGLDVGHGLVFLLQIIVVVVVNHIRTG